MKEPRQGGLGPKQLAWCRANIEGFGNAADRIDAIKKEVIENRIAMTGSPHELERESKR